MTNPFKTSLFGDDAPMLLTEILTGVSDTVTAEHPVLEALNRYHQARRAALSRVCSAAGIDPTGAAAMHEIVLAEQQDAPLTPGQLARILAITTAATTNLIDRLSNAGLIHKTSHPTDRRKRILRPIPDALPELHSAKATLTQLANQLNTHDKALITTLFNKLSAAIEN